MDIHTFLIAVHLIGTALGVGGATFAEIFYVKALRDGEVNPIEGDFLRTTYRVIRFGLALLVLSGFGFLLLYRFTGMEERLYSPVLWSKLTIVFIILINAALIQSHKIPMWLGSALSFASWYAAMLLVPLKVFKYPYLTIMGWYVVAVLVTALVLGFIRKMLGVKI